MDKREIQRLLKTSSVEQLKSKDTKGVILGADHEFDILFRNFKKIEKTSKEKFKRNFGKLRWIAVSAGKQNCRSYDHGFHLSFAYGGYLRY